jgi:outer membrane usher protein
MNAISKKQGHSSYRANSRLLSMARPRSLAWFVMLSLGTLPAVTLAAPAAAAAALEPAVDPGLIEFSSAFTASSQSVDVSRFEKGNPVLPGSYNVDVFANDGRVARKNIQFRAVDGSQVAQPCFDYATLVQMGVDVNKLDPKVVNAQSSCIAIKDIGPAATVHMDVGELRLDVSIPQESLQRAARGYVSPELWDQGESAFLLGYNFNAYSLNQSYGGSTTPAGGTAIGTDGKSVQVQNAQYYVPGPNGSYVPSSTDGYMLANNGSYVPVQRGTFVPQPVSGYSSNDINAYLGLNLGLNVAGWRIRSQETGQWDQRTGPAHWTNINTTATHDITPWKAQFTLGDSCTQGVVFDSTPFRGITMYSDDRMLPDSQQGYAPVVRGTANTQARVEVRQNGNLLYQTTVAPGPFVIDDLYATGYGGDLAVSVFEADGSVHTFAVPFSAVPMLLRPGVDRWSITDGQVHNTALQNNKPYFVEGTYQRGINNWLTLYAGVQSTYTDLSHSFLGGAAVNTPVGAFALDVTNSHTTFDGTPSLSGYSTRVSYSKAIATSGTTFALASYRYSNGNYLSLSDAATTQDVMTSMRNSGQDTLNLTRSKQRLNLTINQDFGGKYGQQGAALRSDAVGLTFDGTRGLIDHRTTDVEIEGCGRAVQIKYASGIGERCRCNTIDVQRVPTGRRHRGAAVEYIGRVGRECLSGSARLDGRRGSRRQRQTHQDRRRKRPQDQAAGWKRTHAPTMIFHGTRPYFSDLVIECALRLPLADDLNGGLHQGAITTLRIPT